MNEEETKRLIRITKMLKKGTIDIDQFEKLWNTEVQLIKTDRKIKEVKQWKKNT